MHLARLDSAQGVEKLFAIKRLLPQLAEQQSVIDMFVTEARIAARISHTNVCQVFELGLEGDELFICMEYLRGVSLTSILSSHKPEAPVDPRIATGIVMQAAAGLQYAHDLRDDNGKSLGVVHRDISPGNLFLTAGGTAKVLDFGVVKANNSEHKTRVGALKGKFGYMSPEQVLTAPLDARSDIFSLGIVLFELLTNRRLFVRDSDYGTMQAITEAEIPSLDSVRAGLPRELGDVVARALTRDVDKRFQRMRDFGEALAKAMAAHGGIASHGELGDFIHSRFSEQLSEIDAMLRGIGKHATPPSAPQDEAIQAELAITGTFAAALEEPETLVLNEGVTMPEPVLPSGSFDDSNTMTDDPFSPKPNLGADVLAPKPGEHDPFAPKPDADVALDLGEAYELEPRRGVPEDAEAVVDLGVPLGARVGEPQPADQRFAPEPAPEVALDVGGGFAVGERNATAREHADFIARAKNISGVRESRSFAEKEHEVRQLYWWLTRTPVLLLLGWFTLSHLLLSSEWVFIDNVNLLFHEAGHYMFMWGSDGLHALGGTLGQLMWPAICGGYFWLKQRQRFAAVACLWWVGENFINIARYMADAPVEALPLVGGGNHDWAFLFRRWDMYQHVTEIAQACRWIGSILMVGSLAYLVYVTLRPSQSELAEGFSA